MTRKDRHIFTHMEDQRIKQLKKNKKLNWKDIIQILRSQFGNQYSQWQLERRWQEYLNSNSQKAMNRHKQYTMILKQFLKIGPNFENIAQQADRLFQYIQFLYKDALARTIKWIELRLIFQKKRTIEKIGQADLEQLLETLTSDTLDAIKIKSQVVGKQQIIKLRDKLIKIQFSNQYQKQITIEEIESMYQQLQNFKLRLKGTPIKNFAWGKEETKMLLKLYSQYGCEYKIIQKYLIKQFGLQEQFNKKFMYTKIIKLLIMGIKKLKQLATAKNVPNAQMLKQKDFSIYAKGLLRKTSDDLFPICVDVVDLIFGKQFNVIEMNKLIQDVQNGNIINKQNSISNGTDSDQQLTNGDTTNF